MSLNLSFQPQQQHVTLIQFEFVVSDMQLTILFLIWRKMNLQRNS